MPARARTRFSPSSPRPSRNSSEAGARLHAHSRAAGSPPGERAASPTPCRTRRRGGGAAGARRACRLMQPAGLQCRHPTAPDIVERSSISAQGRHGPAPDVRSASLRTVDPILTRSRRQLGSRARLFRPRPGRPGASRPSWWWPSALSRLAPGRTCGPRERRARTAGRPRRARPGSRSALGRRRGTSPRRGCRRRQ